MNFSIKSTIALVDQFTSPLAKVNAGIRDAFKPIRELHNATRKLSKELGFPRIEKGFGKVAKGLGGVGAQVRSLGREFAVMAGAAAAAIGGVVWRTSSVGDQAAKMAAKIGIGAQAWTELAYAGKQSGVSAETMNCHVFLVAPSRRKPDVPNFRN